jgi:hypothetical protein
MMMLTPNWPNNAGNNTGRHIVGNFRSLSPTSC